MARVTIQLPETFLFSTKISVRVTDINYANHLGNDAILGMMHEARVQFLKSFSYTELDLGGVGIIMTDCAIQYKGEAFLGDQLEIKVAVSDPSRLGFDLVYQFTNIENKKLIAIGKTGIVCFDYKLRKVSPLPDSVKEKLKLTL